MNDHSDFDLSGGVWTIEAWVKPEYNINTGMIYAQTTGLMGGMYLRVIQDTDFTPSFIITNDVPTTLVQLTGSAISYGGWHHIAVVEDGDNYYLFVDGVLEDSTTDTDRPANYPTNILIGDNYKGLIDEVRVSKGVARWTTDFTPPTQPYS